MPLNLPTHGARIVFDRVPRGSYATAGDAYLVALCGRGGDVRLTRIDAPTVGTFDRPRAYDVAAWRVAE